ncbi:MAG: NAD(P)/FAD-dependent oxidoreductase [Desulfomonile tiedjei]|nr:NAD(P)/FAD-dependent oxidoreductase [Desulfomonile tiedjei]
MIGFDVIIVGGGPAGLAAGVQAGHMGLTVKILEKDVWGGRLCLARRVENFPGLTRPLSGRHVAARLLLQARRKTLSMGLEACTAIDCVDRRFAVETRVNRYTARAVIVACGVQPKRLLVPGLGVDGNRLFYAWRELPHFRGKRIGVIGGGEAAFDQACSLAERGAAVTVLIRATEPRAFHGLVHEALELGVSLVTRAEIRQAEMKGAAVSLQFSDGGRPACDVDYLLAAVGAEAVEVTISKVAAGRNGQGLYWAGDVCSGRYRQAAIASGDGIKTAMIVYDYLRGEEG